MAGKYEVKWQFWCQKRKNKVGGKKKVERDKEDMLLKETKNQEAVKVLKITLSKHKTFKNLLILMFYV